MDGNLMFLLIVKAVIFHSVIGDVVVAASPIPTHYVTNLTFSVPCSRSDFADSVGYKWSFDGGRDMVEEGGWEFITDPNSSNTLYGKAPASAVKKIFPVFCEFGLISRRVMNVMNLVFMDPEGTVEMDITEELYVTSGITALTCDPGSPKMDYIWLGDDGNHIDDSWGPREQIQIHTEGLTRNKISMKIKPTATNRLVSILCRRNHPGSKTTVFRLLIMTKKSASFGHSLPALCPIYEGDVIFKCRNLAWNTTLRVTWSKVFKNGSEVYVQDGDEVKLTKVTKKHSYKYRCRDPKSVLMDYEGYPMVVPPRDSLFCSTHHSRKFAASTGASLHHYGYASASALIPDHPGTTSKPNGYSKSSVIGWSVSSCVLFSVVVASVTVLVLCRLQRLQPRNPRPLVGNGEE